MTKREIIKALLAKRCPERMGLNEHFWPFLIENAWGAQGVTDGDWIKRFGLDIRGLFWCAVPSPRPDLERLVEETEEWSVRRDGWGASFKYWKKKAGTPEHIAFALASPEVWRRDFREATLAIDMRQHVNLEQSRKEYAAAMAGEEFVTFNGLMLFEELRRILGDVNMLESLATEPDFIHDFNTIITQKHIDYYAYLFREVGLPDGVHIFEDLGYTRGPFISPAMHRAMILPYHRRLFGLFKDFKLPIIFHTCGDFRLHLPSLIEAGVDCIQALEAKTGMNVVDLARQHPGQLCFMGNLDIRAFESGDRARIKDEVLGKINGMKALRAPYVFMSDHSLPPSVKLADYEYALELYRANCRY
jgi:uroporphyrinogen decarboxylase